MTGVGCPRPWQPPVHTKNGSTGAGRRDGSTAFPGPIFNGASKPTLPNQPTGVGSIPEALVWAEDGGYWPNKVEFSLKIEQNFITSIVVLLLLL